MYTRNKTSKRKKSLFHSPSPYFTANASFALCLVLLLFRKCNHLKASKSLRPQKGSWYCVMIANMGVYGAYTPLGTGFLEGCQGPFVPYLPCQQGGEPTLQYSVQIDTRDCEKERQEETPSAVQNILSTQFLRVEESTSTPSSLNKSPLFFSLVGNSLLPTFFILSLVSRTPPSSHTPYYCTRWKE